MTTYATILTMLPLIAAAIVGVVFAGKHCALPVPVRIRIRRRTR
jgi:hypothetical protein